MKQDFVAIDSRYTYNTCVRRLGLL